MNLLQQNFRKESDYHGKSIADNLRGAGMEEEKKVSYFGDWENIHLYLKKLVSKISDSEEKKIILLLITRKGYWLFKTILDKDDELRQLVDELEAAGKLQICSDRYVMKEFRDKESEDDEPSILSGHEVWIFDDTVNNGNTLFYYYCKAKKLKAKDIHIMVYAAPADFFMHRKVELQDSEYQKKKLEQYERIFKAPNNSEEVHLSFEEELNKFYANFSSYVVLPRESIAALSIEECLRFQENVNPMVMDLPVFTLRKDSEDEVFLSDEEFIKLKKKTARWEYVENRYGGLREQLVCDFFQLNNDFLYAQYGNLFFNFIVKCKYHKMKEGIKIKFIPFAIIKSATIENVWNCYCKLFNIDNKDMVLELESDHNKCRAVFRAIIYVLSNYIAKLFAEKVNEDLGAQLVTDSKNMKDHFGDSFLELLKKFEEDRRSYEEKISACKCGTPPPVGIILQKKRNIPATEQNVLLYIYNRVLESKSKQGDRVGKIVRIERLEKELELAFTFNTEQQKRLYMTKALILSLEISAIGNEIVVDNNSDMIYRGFRAGENSEVLMPPGLRWVYPYVFAFYYFRDEDFFRSEYEKFVVWLRGLFYEKGYIGSLIDTDTFEFYEVYFGRIDKEHLHERIVSKSYILKDCTDEDAQERQEIFNEMAYDRVREWGETVYGQ